MEGMKFGARHGSLTVASDVFIRYTTGGRPMKYCEALCDCGTRKVVQCQHLASGHTVSCGCHKNELARQRHLKHGQAHTRVYSIWRNMIARCENPKKQGYDEYGAKGVSVCPEWHSFEVFRQWAEANGYADSLTIDRKENHQGYTPDNCRWVTPKQNARNRTDNHLLSAFGESKCLTEWVEDPRCKVSYGGLSHRLRVGWEPEAAISSPKVQGQRINR